MPSKGDPHRTHSPGLSWVHSPANFAVSQHSVQGLLSWSTAKLLTQFKKSLFSLQGVDFKIRAPGRGGEKGLTSSCLASAGLRLAGVGKHMGLGERKI